MKTVQQKWFVIVAMAIMLCLTGLVNSGTAFADRCVDNGDGTVTDNGTGLMWQKATFGSTDWGYAKSYCSGLSLAGHSDWRLPNKDELVELYISDCKNLMHVENSSYWSSTTYTEDTTNAWFVYSYNGLANTDHKKYSYYVRAVRDVQ